MTWHGGECDYCGSAIDERTRIGGVTEYRFDEVWYEWWPQGDYCPECAEALADAVREMRHPSDELPERYSADFQDRIEIEKKLIGARLAGKGRGF